MSNFQLNLIINLSIGVIFIFGLCWFMFKRTNWFKEGGIAYEFFKMRKEQKQAEKMKKAKEDSSNPIKGK